MNGSDIYYSIVFLVIVFSQKDHKNSTVVFICWCANMFCDIIHTEVESSFSNFYISQSLIDVSLTVILLGFISSLGIKSDHKNKIPVVLLVSSIYNFWIYLKLPYYYTLYENYERVNYLLFELIIICCVDTQRLEQLLGKIKENLIKYINTFRKYLRGFDYVLPRHLLQHSFYYTFTSSERYLQYNDSASLLLDSRTFCARSGYP